MIFKWIFEILNTNFLCHTRFQIFERLNEFFVTCFENCQEIPFVICDCHKWTFCWFFACFKENPGEFEKIIVVLGNETCDLDSAVCALVQGFFLASKVKEEKGLSVIPVMNILEKEFRVKTEVVYYLRKHNVASNLLTFRWDYNAVFSYLIKIGDFPVSTVQ